MDNGTTTVVFAYPSGHRETRYLHVVPRVGESVEVEETRFKVYGVVWMLDGHTHRVRVELIK
jgi:hypothetical protein